MRNGTYDNGLVQFSRGLTWNLFANAFRERFLPIYGSGQNTRAWIFVDDNCRAIHMVMEKGENEQVYNIGGGNEKENIEIAKEILRCLSLPEAMT